MKDILKKKYSKRTNTVKVDVPADPMLLSILGYYNWLEDAEKPDLEKVKELKELITNQGVRLA